MFTKVEDMKNMYILIRDSLSWLYSTGMHFHMVIKRNVKSERERESRAHVAKDENASERADEQDRTGLIFRRSLSLYFMS